MRECATDPADAGAATLWTVIAIAVTAVVAGVSVVLGAAVDARHAAATAADEAALAGAMRVVAGGEAACVAARALAAEDGARLSACSVSGAVIDVSVTTPLPGALRHFGVARARARAGP